MDLNAHCMYCGFSSICFLARLDEVQGELLYYPRRRRWRRRRL